MSGKNEVKCPECDSRRVWKNGIRYIRRDRRSYHKNPGNCQPYWA